MFALSNGGTSRPADVVGRSARAGACGPFVRYYVSKVLLFNYEHLAGNSFYKVLPLWRLTDS